MTALVAKYLEGMGGAADILVGVEGPYGESEATSGCTDVLLVTGGAGITHIMSVLDAVLHPSDAGGAPTRGHLVWIVQHLEQVNWVMEDLSICLARAHRPIVLSIQIFVTRGLISPVPSPRSYITTLVSDDHIGYKHLSLDNEATVGYTVDQQLISSSTGAATSIIAGRADVRGVVREFLKGSDGTSRVIVCGPVAVTDDVRAEVAHLVTQYPVELDVASFSADSSTGRWFKLSLRLIIRVSSTLLDPYCSSLL